MRAMGRSGIYKALVITLSLAILCLFLAEITTETRRERRMRQYLDVARQSSAAYSIPLPIILAVIETESDFRPEAVSDAGACGLMQLMPETFIFLRDEKLCEDLSDHAIFDPAVNIRYGSYYLAYLYDRFDAWYTVLAAYNAGEGHVDEWLDDPALSKNGRLVRIPFPETAAYVEKALKAFSDYSEKYPSTP